MRADANCRLIADLERVLGSPGLQGVGGALRALALVLLAWTPRFHCRPRA